MEKSFEIIGLNDFPKYKEMLENAGCIYHHSATHSGYVRRNMYGYIEQYSGHYGGGFVVHRASNPGTTYHTIDYYIQKYF